VNDAQRVPAIRVQVFGIPIEVQASFFLIVGLLGWTGSAAHLAIWVAVALVSILVHELGHAAAARAFGSPASIQLYGFGGLTSHMPTTVARDLVVTLAGPFAGLAIGGVVFALAEALGPLHGDVRVAAIYALWINVVWSIVNLLPILPLDGGNALRAILHLATGSDRERTVRILSIAVAGAAGVWAWSAGYTFSSLFALFFVGTNLGALRSERDAVHVTRLREAAELLERGNPARAADIARSLRAGRPGPRVAGLAGEIEAWAALAGGDLDAVEAALGDVPDAASPPLQLLGAVRLARGEEQQGLALVVDGYLRGDWHPALVLAESVAAAGVTSELVERLLLLDGDTGRRAAADLESGLRRAGREREAAHVAARLADARPG